MRELEQIKARLDAATPGPWEQNFSAGISIISVNPEVTNSISRQVISEDSGVIHYPDATFIVNSPTDMRRLIARVERLEKALEEIRDFDPHNQYGCVDEWEEAAAFGSCVNIASTALAEEDGE